MGIDIDDYRNDKISWKTIMTGPDWTFKLLGLDKDSDKHHFVQQMSSKLETKAVVV